MLVTCASNWGIFRCWQPGDAVALGDIGLLEHGISGGRPPFQTFSLN